MWAIALIWILIIAIRRARRDKNMADEIVESAAEGVDPNDEIIQRRT